MMTPRPSLFVCLCVMLLSVLMLFSTANAGNTHDGPGNRTGPQQFFSAADYETIATAADRNNIGGDLELILFAIRKAENGPAGREFGVLHPRAIDTNLDVQAGWAAATIRKNYERWAIAGCPGTDFIEFLGNRYCPPDAHPKNRHWASNVRHWYWKFKEDRMSDKTLQRTASLLNIPVAEIDTTLYARAVKHVEQRSQTYHDAMSNVGQLPGNPPRASEIATVYDFLIA